MPIKKIWWRRICDVACDDRFTKSPPHIKGPKLMEQIVRLQFASPSHSTANQVSDDAEDVGGPSPLNSISHRTYLVPMCFFLF